MQKYPSFPILASHRTGAETVLETLDITNLIRCENGFSLLSLAEEHKPGIVLLDTGNPGKPDEEIFEQVLRKFPEITVIVTGDNEADQAVRCMKKGAFDYLARPVSHNVFKSCIQCAIEFQECGRKSMNRFGSDIGAQEIRNFFKTEYKMASLGRIWTGIAHEIRTPLSAINIYLGMLRELFEEYSGDQIAEIMAELQISSNRIERIIRKVSDFSKPGTPDMALSDVNQCVTESADLARATLQREGIAIETELDLNIPECMMEARPVSQVILNLLTNAADAMQHIECPKKIKISSSRDEDFIIIKVSDSGPGIVSKDRSRIFEPFFTTKPWGMGIGLSICNRIIRDHGGNIDTGESIAGGAELQVSIPIHKINSKAQYPNLK